MINNKLIPFEEIPLYFYDNKQIEYAIIRLDFYSINLLSNVNSIYFDSSDKKRFFEYLKKGCCFTNFYYYNEKSDIKIEYDLDRIIIEPNFIKIPNIVRMNCKNYDYRIFALKTENVEDFVVRVFKTIVTLLYNLMIHKENIHKGFFKTNLIVI